MFSDTSIPLYPQFYPHERNSRTVTNDFERTRQVLLDGRRVTSFASNLTFRFCKEKEREKERRKDVEVEEEEEEEENTRIA